MIRSPWFWLTVVLIAAGVALIVFMGVFAWLAATLAILILVLVGTFLYNAYGVERAPAPVLPTLATGPDDDHIPVIHDCDLTMGRPFRDVGDGLALLYLLGEPRVDLQFVTTTYGNGPVGMTTRTTRRLLDRLDLEDVEVVQGAGGPETDPHANQAAQRLVDIVNERPGEMVILATGALTNLRHASVLDAEFFKKVSSLHLVGGVTGQLVWNERRVMERNFSLDPEAAYGAIQADCPTTVTLGEAGLTAIFRSPQYAALQALDDPVSKLITRRIRLWFGLMRLWFRDDGFALWESIGASAIVHPEYFSLQRVHLPISIKDLLTGRLVTDPSRAGPVRLVRGVDDYEAFIQTQLAAWRRLGRSLESGTGGTP